MSAGIGKLGELMKWCVAALAALCVAGCTESKQVPGYETFVAHVEDQQLGPDVDHWIETKNAMGDWERTGLIFGYVDDYGMCLEAISALRNAVRVREFRCVPVKG